MPPVRLASSRQRPLLSHALGRDVCHVLCGELGVRPTGPNAATLTGSVVIGVKGVAHEDAQDPGW